MNIDGARESMREHLAAYYLLDEVLIERINTAGAWEPIGTFPANVQYERAQWAPNDPSQATANARSGRYVYVEHGNPAAVGDRLAAADGERWMITAVTPRRTNETYTRITCDREVIGTAPIIVAFTRRIGGQNVTVATAEVRITIDQRDPMPSTITSIFSAATAKGAVLTGVMVGGADLAPVIEGDWFEIEAMPGRVTFVDRTNPERIEVSYRMEARGV